MDVVLSSGVGGVDNIACVCSAYYVHTLTYKERIYYTFFHTLWWSTAFLTLVIYDDIIALDVLNFFINPILDQFSIIRRLY